MRAVVAGVMAAAVLLVQPSPVAAQWRWLEKLSGPGPFVLYQGEIKLRCDYDGEGSTGTEATAYLLGPVLSTPCVSMDPGEDASPEKRRYALGVATGFGVSLDNGLAYAGEPTVANKRVFTIPIELFYDVNPCVSLGAGNKWWLQPCRRFEIGATAGWQWFFGLGAGNVIPSSFKPTGSLRFSYRMLTFGKDSGSTFRGSLKSRVAFHKFAGVRGSDFGALPWTAGDEVLKSWALVLDLDRLK